MSSEQVLGPAGPLEVLSSGSGKPVTVFAHGLGGSIPTTRPFASGLGGTKVFFHFPSHGASAPRESEWSYEATGADLLAVADAVHATSALGVSMGAGSILNVLSADPTRFDRVVLVIPASADVSFGGSRSERYEWMAQASEQGDVDAIGKQLRDELPRDMQSNPAALGYVKELAERFTRPGMSAALRSMPSALAVPNASAFAAVQLPVLVLAQRGDPIHPVEAAERIAASLPNAQLEIFDEQGLLWGNRSRVREVIRTFFDEASQPVN